MSNKPLGKRRLDDLLDGVFIAAVSGVVLRVELLA